MTRHSRHLGFAISLLVHGGFLLGLLGWQQVAQVSLTPTQSVSVQLSMFSPSVASEQPVPTEIPEPKPEPKSQPTPTSPPATASAPLLPAVAAAPASSSACLADIKAAYRASVLKAIESVRFYPNWARRRGIEGTVKIAFTVLTDGHLQSIQLIGRSGSKILDQAAVSALRKLEKLPPIPVKLGMQHWNMIVPMVYRIR